MTAPTPPVTATVPAPAPTIPPAPAPPVEPTPDAPKPAETVDFWKQKAREQEARAKSNADAAKRLEALEEAQKTEAQKAADAKAAAEKTAADAQRELLRYKVAAELGVPADLLAGDDEASIRSHAERLKAFKGEPAKPGTPKPDPSQGGSGQPAKGGADGKAEALRRFGKPATT
jgi:membrane protein involved in colicin uptake